MGSDAKGAAAEGVGSLPPKARPRKNRVKLLPRITKVEAVIHGVLKLVWNDGYEGVVDLRPVISDGEIFEYLRSAGNFAKVKADEYGHCISWVDEKGREIDFGADRLREKAEDQARLIKTISEIHI